MPPFVFALPVRFADVDHAGIVYYPRFFHYFHVAFEELWRARIGHHAGLRLTIGDTPPATPHAPKAILLATILLAFVSGSAIGAVLALSLHHAAILLPAVLLVAGGLYAALGGPDLVEEGSRK